MQIMWICARINVWTQISATSEAHTVSHLFRKEHKDTTVKVITTVNELFPIWSLTKKKKRNGNGVHATFIPFRNTFYLMHYVLIYPSQIKQRLASTYGNLINDKIWFICFILVHLVILIFFNIFLQTWMSTTLNPALDKDLPSRFKRLNIFI